MKAINELTNEHHGIKVMLGIMHAIAQKIAVNENVEISHLDDITGFLSGFADQCHHGKEEKIMFTRMQNYSNPTFLQLLPEILDEHKQGRAIIASLKKELADYRNGDQNSLFRIGRLFNEYKDLLSAHIEKEDGTLFPALAAGMDEALDEELFAAFEKLEEEVIGIGKHEEYHAMLKNLRQIYTNQ